MMSKSFAKARPGRFYLYFDVCTALFVAWLTMFVTGTGGDWRIVAGLAFPLILFLLFSPEKRDEFAEHCWRTATSATFLVLIASPILMGFIHGLAAGFNAEPVRDIANMTAAGSPAASQSRYELTFDGIFALLFATFFATFQWTRFRGGGR